MLNKKYTGDLLLTLNNIKIDLIEFDKDFYDNNRVEPKVLNRFLTNSNSFNLEQNKNESALMKRKSIIIETPETCSFLQKNLVFILNEIGIQFINVIHEKLYEKLWIILCEQIELGDKPLKTMSYNLILTILDLRVIPLNEFDFSKECLRYFVDCILASCHLTYTANSPENPNRLASLFYELSSILIMIHFNISAFVKTKIMKSIQIKILITHLDLSSIRSFEIKVFLRKI